MKVFSCTIRYLIFMITTCLFLMASIVKTKAEQPFGVSTFHSISIYWTPNSIDTTKKVLVKYREKGTQKWYQGYPIVYNNVPGSGKFQKAVYRGSIVNLTPNTAYEIELKEEGTTSETANFNQLTLNEKLPGKTVLKLSENQSDPLTISTSGTANSYRIYDGNNFTIDAALKHQDGIVIDADYVIVRNFNIKNTTRNGIHILGNHHHIVIEGCDISKWGSLDTSKWTYNNKTPDEPGDDISGNNQDTSKTQFGMNDQSAIYAYNGWDGPSSYSLVIQRNKLHHPNYDTNNWNELHGTPYNGDKGKHPNGPGVVYLQNSGGNNIIRFNEIYSDSAHFFNDGIGGRVNTSFRGYPGPDSDIYGNYISYCQDDAFELEGGVQNVRVWNNFVENTLQGIANACVKIGPLYVWRNVYGKGTTVAGGGAKSLYSIKMGFSGGIKNATGKQYYFNNTYLQPDDEGYGGFGTMGSLKSNRPILHVTTRNNILQARSTAQQAISQSPLNTDNDFNYDLISTPAASFPKGHEVNGISGLPVYATGWGFEGTPGKTALKGIFQLQNNSAGKDSGQIIPNFSDVYTGNGPDIGAHEGQTPHMKFGVSATFTPVR